MINRRGAELAWSAISDLGCNPPGPGNRRDHEAGLAEGAGVEGDADRGDLAVADVAPVGHQQRLAGGRGVQLEPCGHIVAVHEHAADHDAGDDLRQALDALDALVRIAGLAHRAVERHVLGQHGPVQLEVPVLPGPEVGSGKSRSVSHGDAPSSKPMIKPATDSKRSM